jgi:hypothetical protein
MIDTIELLKLAAKAAGFDVVRVAADGESLMLYGVQEPWNPAIGDADSRLLQVACKIALHFEVQGGVDVAEAYSQEDEDMVSLCACEPLGTEPLKAARMAVLRCAGMIGEAME